MKDSPRDVPGKAKVYVTVWLLNDKDISKVFQANPNKLSKALRNLGKLLKGL